MRGYSASTYHTVLARTGVLTYHHIYCDVPCARICLAFTFVCSPSAARLFMIISHARLLGIGIPYCPGPHGFTHLSSDIQRCTVCPRLPGFHSRVLPFSRVAIHDHISCAAAWHRHTILSWFVRTYVLYVLSSLSAVRVYLPELSMHKYPARYRPGSRSVWSTWYHSLIF